MNPTGIEVVGDEELIRFFAEITGKLQRGAIRKGVAAGGQALVREIRQELAQAQFEDSRGASLAGRRAAKEAGQKPLRQTIGKKAWSVPRRGIIGQVVGPLWPAGAHGHLVERGHRIVTVKKAGHRDTGQRTKAFRFQEKAERRARRAVTAAIKNKLAEAIRKAHAKQFGNL